MVVETHASSVESKDGRGDGPQVLCYCVAWSLTKCRMALNGDDDGMLRLWEFPDNVQSSVDNFHESIEVKF